MPSFERTMTDPVLKSVMLAVVLCAPVAATESTAQDARPAIEERYQRLAEAIRRNDIDQILAVIAPGYTSVNAATSDTFDYAAMERYTRRMMAAIDSVIHIRNIIRDFQQRGDTAVADVCQEFSRVQRIDQIPRRVDTSALQRETWIRLGDEWKRYRVENVRGNRWFVDGVRIDPSRPYTPGMPAHEPAVDPPTGCGLR
jgi:hypothetical protein